MKAILEFNLPEDNDEFKAARRGMKAMSIIYGMDLILFRAIKEGIELDLTGLKLWLSNEIEKIDEKIFCEDFILKKIK